MKTHKHQKDVMINLRIPVDLRDELREQVTRYPRGIRVTFSDIARVALEEGLRVFQGKRAEGGISALADNTITRE